MDSKSIGLCPQGFESPRCRLQGWREATENSWRLVGGCEAVAPSPEETVCRLLNYWLWSPGKTTPPGEVRRLVQGASAELTNLCGMGQRPLMAEGKEKFGNTSPQQGTRTCEHGVDDPRLEATYSLDRELVGMGRGLMMAEGSESSKLLAEADD